MSDTSQGPGWWLASDGRWYPPETAPAPPPPPPPPTTNDVTAAPRPAADSAATASPSTPDDAPHVLGDQGSPSPPPGAAPPSTDPTKKSFVRRPIFWAVAAAVIVVIVIAAVAGGSNNKNAAQTTQTSLSSSTGATGNTGSNSGSTGSNSGSTGNSGSTTTEPLPTTTTTTQPSNLAIGAAESFTSNGAPDDSVTVAQFVDPAQPEDSYVTPTNAGDRYVAVLVNIKSIGTIAVSDDIYNDTKLYDSAGQGFTGDFEAPSNGPTFPSGEINVAPGGTASGWEMFEVPGNATGFTLTFTPQSGFATQAATTWAVGN